MGENGADVKTSDPAGIDPGGANPAVATASADATPPPGCDVELLIADAVCRISSAITPVAVLAPNPPHSHDEGQAQPRLATENNAPQTVGSVPPADNRVLPAPETLATEIPPAEFADPSPPDHALSYVPSGGDRITPEPPRTAENERIEPTFDSPPPASGLTAEPTLTAPAATAPSPTQGWQLGHLLEGPWTWRRIARLAGLAVAAYFATVLVLILAYRVINPPTTTLIAYQWLTGTKIEQDWEPIENISSNLLRAVVVSEDWGFCDHYGVDIDALEKALELAGEGKVARGASTISMQVIKNLFLSQSKSYLRKAIEIPLTVVAEAVWPKSRMLEIYLNIAEWGPGVFGAEAAARHHFNKPASRLTEREAALLAAALPNPILRDAGDPGTRTSRKATVIQARMRAAGPVANCAMTDRQRSTEGPADRDSKSGSGWQTTVKKRAGTDPGL